jgi:hypothetical protein
MHYDDLLEFQSEQRQGIRELRHPSDRTSKYLQTSAGREGNASF